MATIRAVPAAARDEQAGRRGRNASARAVVDWHCWSVAEVAWLGNARCASGVMGFPSYRGDIALREDGDGRGTAKVRSGLPGGRGTAGAGDRQADRAGRP